MIVIMIELFEHSALGYAVGRLAYMIMNRLTQRYIVSRTLHTLNALQLILVMWLVCKLEWKMDIFLIHFMFSSIVNYIFVTDSVG